MIGSSQVLEALRQHISAVSCRRCTVLIEGETGTGKELVARQIHAGSPRSAGPFVPVDCSTLPETLFESQMFGHVRGAFTGAQHSTLGFIRSADGGTLFLDEIGELPLAAQAKMLRCLQERAVVPVGSTKPIEVNIRIVAATHRDLLAMVGQGTFREDLYYRMNVIPMELPPLRERRSDIPLLAGHFIALYSRRMGKPVEGIDQGALEILMDEDWPGNVRELENMIERAVALTDGDRITREDLTGRIFQAGPPALEAEGMDLEEKLREVERTYIERALKTTGGNLTRAAELLGIPFRSIRYRIKKLDIERLGAGSSDRSGD